MGARHEPLAEQQDVANIALDTDHVCQRLPGEFTNQCSKSIVGSPPKDEKRRTKKPRAMQSFVIYEDKQENTGSYGRIDHSFASQQKNCSYFTKIKQKANRLHGIRVISDTILVKRKVSIENGQSCAEQTGDLNCSILPSNMENSHFHPLVTASSGEKSNMIARVCRPLGRKVMATISPRINSASHAKDVVSKHQKAVICEEGLADENKENVYRLKLPDSNSPLLSDQSKSSLHSPKPDSGNPTVIFHPQYYWNRCWNSKDKELDQLLREFHRLLYDYEKLWEYALSDQNITNHVISFD